MEKKHGNAWKGGITESNGRVYIRLPEHPRSNNGYVRRSHLVMEEKLGRYLKPWEIVHHKDENKKNDDPKNLEVMTKVEHIIHHKPYRFRSEEEKQRLGNLTRGKPRSEEHKAKLSKSLQGNTPWNKGSKGVQKAWNKGIKTKPLSEDHKNKISESIKIAYKEGKKKSTKGTKIKPFTEEHKNKIREAVKKNWEIRKARKI